MADKGSSEGADAAWSSFASELGLNLQRRRLELGLSQEDVAYRSGLSQYTYQKYEAGVARPGSAANPHAQKSGGDLSDAGNNSSDGAAGSPP